MNSEIVESLTAKAREILDAARSLVEASMGGFVTSHIKMLGGLIGAYKEAFTKMGVSSREEAQKVWTDALLNDQLFEERMDALLDAEKDFDDFLRYIDSKMYSNGELTEPIEEISSELKVRTVDNSVVSLQSLLPEKGSLLLIFLRHFA